MEIPNTSRACVPDANKQNGGLQDTRNEENLPKLLGNMILTQNLCSK